MTYPDRRLSRRESFERVASSYTAGRPAYPDTLVADLVRLAGVGPASRILEIGPGTGQLTMPLAETGASIVAVELGPELAGIARSRLSRHEGVEVVVADFDSWVTPPEAFDVVVAATSFHWLDPGTRVARCRSALRARGTLAVVATRWGVRTASDDPFFDRSQRCYARWDPEHDPSYWHPRPDDVPTGLDDIERSGVFGEHRHRRYVVERTYTGARYLELIRTYSTVQSWPAARRDGFLRCIRQMIGRELGGEVVRSDLYDLTVATAI